MNALTARQSEIHELLIPGEYPSVSETLARDLRSRLESEVLAVAEGLPAGVELYVDKWKLNAIHRCLGYYLASGAEEFSWTAQKIRGKVTHRAIERLILGRYEGTPIDLVQEAIEYLKRQERPSDLARFLEGLDPSDAHDVIRECADIVEKFLSDWLPISFDLAPRLESYIKVELAFGRVSLAGRFDLTLGRPRGNEARTIIIDLKTGGQYTEHLDDLRFYALLETLRAGVPPFRVASYYFDRGTFQCEDVNEEVLDAAMARAVTGIRKLADVHGQSFETVERTPSQVCSWCPARLRCPEGRDFLAAKSPATRQPSADKVKI